MYGYLSFEIILFLWLTDFLELGFWGKTVPWTISRHTLCLIKATIYMYVDRLITKKKQQLGVSFPEALQEGMLD